MSDAKFNNIDEFSGWLHDDIASKSNLEDDLNLDHHVFCYDFAFPILHEVGDCDNIQECHYSARGVKIDGYQLNDQKNELILLLAHYNNDSVDIESSQIKSSCKLALNFFNESIKGIEIPRESEAYDLQQIIIENWKTISRVRIIYLTDCNANSFPGWKTEENKRSYSYEVWDIDRFYNFYKDGVGLQTVKINFDEFSKEPLILVKADDDQPHYISYLGFIDGKTLSKMYDRFSGRLLERNVRTYLSAGQKVNKSMMLTIENEPEMFLAYNNGLTVIAKSIELDDLGNKTYKLVSAENFEIVNGGQTSSAIWEAKERRRFDISKIRLAMKLNIIKKEKNTEKLAKSIARYSNAQNKVNLDDFRSNDPFHQELKRMSEIIFAPDPRGGDEKTKWFYERSRGSYKMDQLLESPSNRTKWKKIHPNKQMFNKLLIGKLEMTFLKKPQTVCKGDQKNFEKWHLHLHDCEEMAKDKKNSKYLITPDEVFFKNLIAKMIIWKETLILVSDYNKSIGLTPGTYRSNIIPYTIAYYLHKSANKIDLVDIWNNQSIGEEMQKVLSEIIKFVKDHLDKNTGEIREYSKKDECWEKLKKKKNNFPNFVEEYFKNLESDPIEAHEEVLIMREEKKKNELKKIESYLNDADKWFSISKWGKETELLHPSQRGIAFTIGRFIANGKKLSEKQVKSAALIIKVAKKHNKI